MTPPSYPVLSILFTEVTGLKIFLDRVFPPVLRMSSVSHIFISQLPYFFDVLLSFSPAHMSKLKFNFTTLYYRVHYLSLFRADTIDLTASNFPNGVSTRQNTVEWLVHQTSSKYVINLQINGDPLRLVLVNCNPILLFLTITMRTTLVMTDSCCTDNHDWQILCFMMEVPQYQHEECIER